MRKKNIPNIAGDEQQPGDVRDGAVAVGEQPQRRDRRGRAQLDQDESGEQRDAGGEGERP